MNENPDIAGTPDQLISFFDNTVDMRPQEISVGTYFFNLLTHLHPMTAAHLRASNLNPEGLDQVSDEVKQFVRDNWWAT